MIFSDFLRALGQLGDPRFRRVLWISLALTLALLIGVYALFLTAIQTFVADTITLPLIGPVGGIDAVLGWGSALLLLILSVFLMIPVASAFAGLFLESVVAAVEASHYPALPPVPPARLSDSLIDSANFLGLLVALNILALLAYPFAGPAAPLLFYALNGYLLGREYFTLVAMRRLGRSGARTLRSRHAGQIWLAGTLMALPLSVPILNLLIPILGVATFTHLFQRVARGG